MLLKYKTDIEAVPVELYFIQYWPNKQLRKRGVNKDADEIENFTCILNSRMLWIIIIVCMILSSSILYIHVIGIFVKWIKERENLILFWIRNAL